MTTTASTDADTIITQQASRFNDQFGEMSSRAKEKVKGEMSDFVQKFIAASPFAVMATADPEGNCDASPKGGKPGFVKVIDGTRLLLPDVAGNRLFQSYQNMDTNPHVGLLFMIPGINDTVRINGTISIVDKEELERQKVELELYWTDDNSKHLQSRGSLSTWRSPTPTARGRTTSPSCGTRSRLRKTRPTGPSRCDRRGCRGDVFTLTPTLSHQGRGGYAPSLLTPLPVGEGFLLGAFIINPGRDGFVRRRETRGIREAFD